MDAHKHVPNFMSMKIMYTNSNIFVMMYLSIVC